MSKDLILESGAKTIKKLWVLVSDIGPYFNLKTSEVFYGPQIRLFKYSQHHLPIFIKCEFSLTTIFFCITTF